MRILFVWLLLVPAGQAQEDDDPKAAASASMTTTTSTITPTATSTTATADDASVTYDEDDPKGARGTAIKKRHTWRIDHHVPRVKLAYRNFSTVGLQAGTDLPFHVVELDYYPSSGYLRFGIDSELGLNSGPFSAWFLTTGAALGFQYPYRVTPFVEARFVAGLMGGSAMGATAVSYTYMGGIDTGVELYTFGRAYLTAAIGWVHPVYSGVDIDWVKMHPGLAPARKDFASDSFTFKVGLGL
jgi:hypothetical protein